jgi:hypothetical protein
MFRAQKLGGSFQSDRRVDEFRVLPVFRITIALFIQATMLIAREPESEINTGNTATN